ncbi:MAG: hypothetical protein IGS23_14040 [Rivularia sp. T60_A2020_040]|nr:hypothetical protein [Rivularia sp. T60_A2020_040]
MSEKIKVTTRSVFENSVISEILGIRELIKNRDVGDIVASPLPEYARANPFELKITIYLFPVKEPPFYKVGYVRPYINIPEIKRNNLNWTTIKKIAGGSNGYMWGRFRCTVNLDNNRQLAVYGATDKEAEERVNQILEIITPKELTRSISEEKKRGQRKDGKPLFKESTRIYPGYFTVVSSKKVSDEFEREKLTNNEKLKPTISGKFKRHKTEKIPLWVKNEPKNANEIIQESLRNRG